MSVQDECICKNQRKELINTHYGHRNIAVSLIGRDEDRGIVIFENNAAIATFDIKYCPICGKKLYGGGDS